MTEEQLSALLRIKRYEKPPPGYFDRLLQDVHRRQRSELLQRPLWQIAAERVRVFFSEHSMGNLTYAGSMATLLLAGVLAIRLMTGGEAPNGTKQTLADAHTTFPAERPFTLELPPAAPTARTFPVSHPAPAATASRPRYVIDARPVSYESSRNIAF